MRYAKQYVLLHPNDCDPPHGLSLDPESRDQLKVSLLHDDFKRGGFGVHYPALVGYPLAGKIQLLTGTHRHEAARRLCVYEPNFRLPVSLRLRSDVERLWGTEGWAELIRDTTLVDLERAPVREGYRDYLSDLQLKVEPSRDLIWSWEHR